MRSSELLLIAVVACGPRARPAEEPAPVIHEPDAGMVGSAGAHDIDPCQPALDPVVTSRCYVDQFCACNDRACGARVNRHQIDVMQAFHSTPLSADELFAEAHRMAECSSRWK